MTLAEALLAKADNESAKQLVQMLVEETNLTKSEVLSLLKGESTIGDPELLKEVISVVNSVTPLEEDDVKAIVMAYKENLGGEGAEEEEEEGEEPTESGEDYSSEEEEESPEEEEEDEAEVAPKGKSKKGADQIVEALNLLNQRTKKLEKLKQKRLSRTR